MTHLQPQPIQPPHSDGEFRQSGSVTAAYVHIPFCRRRCYYCDFPISVVGDRPPISSATPPTDGHGSQAIAHYVEVLVQEIAATLPLGEPLKTVFFGGGTPSLLSTTQLKTILTALRRQFGIDPAAEISMEMDPGTFTLAQLEGYQSAGINRISLGVQSFDSELLARCGRTHTAEDVDVAIAMIRQVHIPNVSLDLMSGLPYQTLDQWRQTLERVVAIAPPHISVYDLTIEPGTSFHRWYRPGTAPLPSDDATAEMYRLTQQALTTAGYDHYEISNYAKPGYQCQHNQVYWENRSYYGFGMGATSYLRGARVARPRTRRDYAAWVQDYVAYNGDIANSASDAESDLLLDTLMLGLRLSHGIRLSALVATFGADVVQRLATCLLPFQAQGWVECRHDATSIPLEQVIHELPMSELSQWQHCWLRLTDPEGFLFSNVILSTLFHKLTP